MSLQRVCDYFLVAILLTFLFRVGSAYEENTCFECDPPMRYPVVKIPQGVLQGFNTMSEKGRFIASFLGIPYAKPPIGKLRFSNPVPPDPWTGIRFATTYGSPCPQLGLVGSEDCLFLNVFTPKIPKTQECSRLPVMVYIHGGGFEGGSSNSYASGHLLEPDIVLATINYRLGALGFVCTGDEEASGNWGMKDQVQALKWVQENIAYFGGDPKRVTIFGESAGGGSVQLLALSDLTDGLFQGYIAQSGSALANWAYRSSSTLANTTRKVGQILNCPTNTSSALIDCLRTCNSTDIVNTRFQLWEWQYYPIIPWGPTDELDIEGAFLTDDPEKLLAAGKGQNVSSILGVCNSDGLAFVPGPYMDSPVHREYITKFDEVAHIVLQFTDKVRNISSYTAAIKKFYFNDDVTTNQTEVWAKSVDLLTDVMFTYPAYKSLQQQSACPEKQSSFFYTFEYWGTFSWGRRQNNVLYTNRVVHGEDLLYLFPLIKSMFPSDASKITEPDLRMIETMTQLWTSFAAYGKPSTAPGISNTTWYPYGSDHKYLRIGNGPARTLDLLDNYVQERMDFWDELNYHELI